ncbi:MAG: DNA polymerase III subunit delta [Lachnospiraceae bacterium]|nr:DNA polymerase III subunit delta [Lachnospiraceae bacterium]
MLRINEDIKSGEFKSVYLLYGEEDYLRFQFRDKLIKALVKEGDTMNFARFSGKDISIPQIIDLAETLPFFADHRVILIEDSGFFESSCEDLAKYIQEPSQSTIFVFSETKVDKRNKLYKAVDKQGIAAEMRSPEGAQLSRWIASRMAGYGKSFASGALLDYFVKRVGTDMMTVDNELIKLSDYLGEREVVQKEDVDAVCIPQLQDMLFVMLGHISKGEKKQALRYYYDLVALRRAPMMLLSMLNRQVNQLLQTKDLQLKRRSDKEIEEAMKVKNFVVRKNKELAAAFDLDTLQQMLELGISTETDIKMGNLQDNIGVEMLVIRFSDIASDSLSKKYRRRS